jgi:UTP--glucose-1-phosphate uridylyltransferase
MIEGFEQSGAQAAMICVTKPYELLYKYGVVESYQESGWQFLSRIVEKPVNGEAPSNLVNISKYILGPEIWPILAEQTVDSKSGELYITDTVQTLATNNKVLIHQPQGVYLDGGCPLGWLLANLTVARDQPEIWSEVVKFVKQN